MRNDKRVAAIVLFLIILRRAGNRSHVLAVIEANALAEVVLDHGALVEARGRSGQSYNADAEPAPTTNATFEYMNGQRSQNNVPSRSRLLSRMCNCIKETH